jgi:hypothetical protein
MGMDLVAEQGLILIATSTIHWLRPGSVPPPDGCTHVVINTLLSMRSRVPPSRLHSLANPADFQIIFARWTRMVLRCDNRNLTVRRIILFHKYIFILPCRRPRPPQRVTPQIYKGEHGHPEVRDPFSPDLKFNSPRCLLYYVPCPYIISNETSRIAGG